MNAIVYQSKDGNFLYIKIKVGNDEKYYTISAATNEIKYNVNVRGFIKTLKGKNFEFAFDDKDKDNLEKLKKAAQTAWTEKAPEESKVEPKKPEPQKESPKEPAEKPPVKVIRTFINDKAIGDKVYADLGADTKLSAMINKAIEKLGYQIFKTARADTPLIFTLENNTNGLVINISSDGTMILDNLKAKKEITTKDTEDAVTAIKETYKVLGVTTEQYSFEPMAAAPSPAKGLRAATSAANTRGGYHYYLETYTKEINAKLKSHAYTVNTTAHTLENSNGQKITVNDDGSTEGTLFSNLGDASTAQNIANDHIAVIKMHLALLHLVPPIFPAEKMVNLFLIQKNLSDAQKAQVPALQAEIKRLIEIEFAKDEYNDIRAMIRYEGQPLGAPAPAPSAPPPDSLKISRNTPPTPPTSDDTAGPKPPAPPADDDFHGKVRENIDTGKMWLYNTDIYSITKYALVESFCNSRNLILGGKAERNDTVFERIADNSNNYFPPQRPVYVAMNHNNNHFALVYIDLDDTLHYINSMSGDKIATEAMLRKKFPGFKRYDVEYRGEQKDGWSCGYRVAREILKVHGLHDHPLVKAETSEEIRDACVAIAKEHVKKITFSTRPFFEDVKKSGDAIDGKLTYFAISEQLNKEFFNKVSGIATEKLQAEITNLCKTDPKFRHALLESAPHYIYWDDKDTKRGVGIDGRGENAMGMALMEARNELFREKNAKHPLIVNPETLRDQARDERKEIDRDVGAENTKGKTFVDIRILFQDHKKTKEAAAIPIPDSPRPKI